MMFLWATLVILSKVQPGSIGGFLQKPTEASASSTIIVYLFTLGMLFLSLKISSSFSHKITGFGVATAALGWGGKIAGGSIGYASRFGVRRFEKTEIGKKLASGDRLWGAPGSGQLRGLEKALSIAGGKALTTATKSSFNPARLTAALGDKYTSLDKRYGLSTQGKGGVVAEDKRADSAREEGLKSLGEQMSRASKVSDAKRKEIFDRTVAEGRTSQATANTKQKEMAEKVVADERKQMASLQQEIGKLASKKAELSSQTGADAAIIKKEIASVEEKQGELQRKVQESADNILKAQQQADEVITRSRDVKGIEEAAFKQVNRDAGDMEKESFNKTLEAKFANDPYARESARAYFGKSKKKEDRQKILADLVEKAEAEAEKKTGGTAEKKDDVKH
jgi:hypothetical protein